MMPSNYKLEYLPLARQDMVDIVTYISRELHNPIAAGRLAEAMVDAAEKLTQFPYANPVYMPIRPLKKEYRKLIVQKYILFYWVDETSKTITVARVLYGRRDLQRFLE